MSPFFSQLIEDTTGDRDALTLGLEPTDVVEQLVETFQKLMAGGESFAHTLILHDQPTELSFQLTERGVALLVIRHFQLQEMTVLLSGHDQAFEEGQIAAFIRMANAAVGSRQWAFDGLGHVAAKAVRPLALTATQFSVEHRDEALEAVTEAIAIVFLRADAVSPRLTRPIRCESTARRRSRRRSARRT